MKNYNVIMIEVRAVTLNLEAKSQPDAVKQAYAHQEKLNQAKVKELVKIKAEQRFN